MAVQYPADYEIFSLVRIDADYCKPKDESIVKYVSDKLGIDFIATAESDKTLYVMRDLEQMIGREIIWVTGKSFDQLTKKSLPNKFTRFCTIEMKLTPISEWWLANVGEKVKMRVGFRYDEKERAIKFRTDTKIKVGKSDSGRNKWKSFEWREGEFPLIENKITHYPIYQWAKSSGLVFPDDSNCVGCFWKPFQQLRKNWEDEPLKMRWFMEKENNTGRTFKKEYSMKEISRMSLQQDFFFGTGSGCQAGFCTD